MRTILLLCCLTGIFGYGMSDKPRCELVIASKGVESKGSLVAWGGELNHFYCAVQCIDRYLHVSPALTWYRVRGTKEKPIKEITGRYFAYRAGQMSRLTFTNFLKRDVGRYKCKGWLGIGKGWQEKFVDITYGCHAPSFLCDSSRCVPPEGMCNGTTECHDGLDESNCGVCGANEFMCEDGSCIKSEFKCDGYYDCMDDSDEKNCSCHRDHEFTCEDGSCISLSKRCDGNKDCTADNGSDEDLCDVYDDNDREGTEVTSTLSSKTTDTAFTTKKEVTSTTTTTTTATTTKAEATTTKAEATTTKAEATTTTEATKTSKGGCGSDGFQCEDGTCIQLSYRCDEYEDCMGGEDESNCPTPSSVETTPTPTSIPTTVFGGSSSGSETATYTTLDVNDTCLPEFEFACADSRECIPLDWFCDGYQDCENGSDESNCPAVDGCLLSEFNCGESICVSLSKVCNGVNDCPFANDELGCTACENDEFTCGDGTCIPTRERCDQFPDCPDESDEEWCATGLTCSESMIACNDNKFCYRKDQLCNGVADCADSSDESNCSVDNTNDASVKSAGEGIVQNAQNQTTENVKPTTKDPK